MIREVTLRKFKWFDDVTFRLPGNVVLAGPNNAGKTTLLQAIAAWSLALDRWKQLNDFRKHKGAYAKAPLARQAFYAVPLRTFDLLWTDRSYQGSAEIEIHHRDGWQITMELIADSSEQVYVRPKPNADPDAVRNAMLQTVYVPAMSGLGIAEPVYQRPKLDQLLGQGKPGDILRNLLVEAHQSDAWQALPDSIRRLFGYEILPPDASGADIIAEYLPRGDGPRLDIASAGSGFQQVLMLLTFLHTRPASVLLLDEPDAHLHVILQDAIYGELQSVAVRQRSQLVIATHSEVIINSVDPTELCMLLKTPRLLSDAADQRRLAQSMGILSNLDILLAENAPGVLFTEDYTDLDIVREWAGILQHATYNALKSTLLCKKIVTQPREGAPGISAKDYYDKLTLVRADLPGVELVDGDAHPNIQSTAITGTGLQRLRWKRYEIESYLVHPAALERFVERIVGPGQNADLAKADMRKFFESQFGKELSDEFYANPLQPKPIVENFLRQTKARVDIIPPLLSAAGIHGFPYTRYHEIAALMLPAEIHSEVREKLDAIQKAFGL